MAKRTGHSTVRLDHRWHEAWFEPDQRPALHPLPPTKRPAWMGDGPSPPRMLAPRKVGPLPARPAGLSPKLTKSQKVIVRDGGHCRYCGAKATTMDHVIPKSKGGSSALDNLAASCWPCNFTKADRTPKQAGMVLYPANVWI